MASLWWKVVGKLPEDKQNIIQNKATKILSRQQITSEENELISTYAGHGFSLLSQKDKNRYFYFRSKAIEKALRRE